jgi:hypothetical protein
MKIDLHNHTVYSPDSSVEVKETVAAAKNRGMDGIAVTDHNTVKGSIAAMEFGSKNFVVLTGCELSTAEGHLLCIGITEDIPPGLNMTEAVDRVVSLGGIAVPSHPFRLGTGAGGDVLGRLNVKAIETVNGRNHSSRNSRAVDFASSRNMGGTGGSDSHFAYEVGRAYTVIEGSGLSAGDIMQEIASGRSKGAGTGQSVSGSAKTMSKIVSEFIRRKGKHI